MKPDDPRVRSGKYMMCGCDYCNKPSYYRELETPKPQVQEVIHRHSDMSKKEFAELQRLGGQVKYLLAKAESSEGYKYT